MPRRRWIPNKQYWGEDYGRPVLTPKCPACGKETTTFLNHPTRDQLTCIPCAKGTDDAESN